jgi:2-methylcitrate dehydratase PrpD
VLELTAKVEPATGLEGKFSVYHAAAVAIIERKAGEPQFSDACVRSPQIVALRRRVTATANAEIRKTEARVRIHLRNGTVLEKHVPHALGTLERPLSDGDIEAKFRSLVDGVLTASQATALIELSWKVTELPDAGAIARAAVP